MRKSTSMGIGALLTGTLIAIGASTAFAMPIGGRPEPPDCPDGYHPVGRRCLPDPPPPPPPAPVNNPFGSLDAVRQTTSQDGVLIQGWAADSDAPTTPLTVKISIDGGVQTFTAGSARDDVAAAYPGFGSNHGFDVVVPLSGNDHTVCVTAVNTGSGTDLSLGCKKMDWVTKFLGNNIVYDFDHAVIGSPTQMNLYKTDYNNATSQQATLVVTHTKDTEQASSWQNTQKAGLELSVEFKGKGSILGFVGVETTVGAKGTIDLEFQQSGSSKITDTWSWTDTQPVAPWRWAKATVAVSHYTIDVPYVMNGFFAYNSGFQAAGSQAGMYSGGDANDLAISVREYYNDGTPVAEPPHLVKPQESSRISQVSSSS